MYGDRGSTAPALGMNSDFSRTLKTQMVRVVIIIVMLMVVIVWLVGWLLLLLLNCIWNIPSCSVVVFAMTVMAPMVIGNVVDVDVDVDGIVLLGILQYQPEC
jgi:multidrug resistance efflux pump